ncbi:uncharacterized protein [Rutidosis leptorrhynchoides]|uniref:uncharacterized protein isoform X2 n=1 Tax=Rutidosis leptorrhynchoides TaxID=125765 RepID=UPI003A9990F6
MKHKTRSQSSKQASKSVIIDDQQPQVVDSCKRRKTTTSAKENEKGDKSTTGRKIQQLHSLYPNNVSVSEEEILETTPGCCNNCSCKLCMPEDRDGYSCAEHDKILCSKHSLREANEEEQLMETELEANLKVTNQTESDNVSKQDCKPKMKKRNKQPQSIWTRQSPSSLFKVIPDLSDE